MPIFTPPQRKKERGKPQTANAACDSENQRKNAPTNKHNAARKETERNNSTYQYSIGLQHAPKTKYTGTAIPIAIRTHHTGKNSPGIYSNIVVFL